MRNKEVNMKKIKLALLSLLFLVSILPISQVEAMSSDRNIDEEVLENNKNIVEVYIQDFPSEEELSNYTTELMQDPDVDGVRVLNRDLASTSAQRRALPLRQWVTVSGKRMRFNGRMSDVAGATINSVAGAPGITIGLDYTKSIAASYTGSATLNATIVSATVGFSVSKSYSVSYKGNYKVEEKNKGKKVKKVTLNAKPLYARYSYSNKSKNGISNYVAKKPMGIEYSKVYTYQ